MSSGIVESGEQQNSIAPVIAGIGAVTGYGWGEKRLREGLYRGRSAVRAVHDFLPWSPGQTVWLSLVDEEQHGSEPEHRRGQTISFAAREALADAFDHGWRPKGAVGLLHAADSTQGAWAELSAQLELHGPAMFVNAGSVSGSLAFLTAKAWIQSGVADDVLVICSDLSVTPERCLPTSGQAPVCNQSPLIACRPFQEGSVGPNPGEATVALLVSKASPSPYAHLLGGAVATAAGGLDQTLRLALLRALGSSGVHVEDVSYVNAHGSGQPTVDAAEAAVFDELLPSDSGLYSLKPLVGDCGVASSALELVGAVYGFATGVVPAPSRMAAGNPRLLDGPTASEGGIVAKTSLDASGTAAVVFLSA